MRRERSAQGLERSMWADACELIEEAERIRRWFFVPGRTPAGVASWEPPVDVFETAEDIRVVVALPGVALQDLEISLQADTLIVAGRRTWPSELKRAKVHRLELPHGRFERRIRIAFPQLALGEATLANGCLELILEKRT